VAIAVVLSLLYGVLLLSRPLLSSPDWLAEALVRPSQAVYALIDGAARLATGHGLPYLPRSGVYLLLISGLVPWIVAWAIGSGRPRDIGIRRPNRYAGRFLLIGFVCSVPFQLWMVRGPGFAAYYLGQLERAGAVTFVLYYLVNMLVEHFSIHGVVLALCRRGHRWPPRVPAPQHAIRRRPGLRWLQWVGMAAPTGGGRGLTGITRWLGLPDGCLPALVTSTLLFGLVHWGKNTRELLLSLPGGLLLAYMAYRSNTWLTVFVLHVVTAGTALLMILMMH
jgi:hypothetical protein